MPELELKELLEKQNKAFADFKPELSGEQATNMKHGIVFFDGTGPVFVETVPGTEPIDLSPDRNPLETPE